MGNENQPKTPGQGLPGNDEGERGRGGNRDNLPQDSSGKQQPTPDKGTAGREGTKPQDQRDESQERPGSTGGRR